MLPSLLNLSLARSSIDTGKRKVLDGTPNAYPISKSLPLISNKEELDAFLHKFYEGHSKTYWYLQQNVLLPGCGEIQSDDILSYWSGYANVLLKRLDEHRSGKLHKALTLHLPSDIQMKEPRLIIDNTLFIEARSPAESVYVYSSPHKSVCRNILSVGDVLRYEISYRDPGGIFAHAYPLWLFTEEKWETSGDCRLDIEAPPDAIHLVFPFDYIPASGDVGSYTYNAVQLKSNYVLVITGYEELRVPFLRYDTTNIGEWNRLLKIYKCVACRTPHA